MGSVQFGPLSVVELPPEPRGTYPLMPGLVAWPFSLLIRGRERLQNLVAGEDWDRSPALALNMVSGSRLSFLRLRGDRELVG